MLPTRGTRPYKDVYLASLDKLIVDLNRELRRMDRFVVKAIERRRGYTDEQLTSHSIIFGCDECGVNYVIDALTPFEVEGMPDVLVCDYCSRALSRSGDIPKVLKMLFDEQFINKMRG